MKNLLLTALVISLCLTGCTSIKDGDPLIESSSGIPPIVSDSFVKTEINFTEISINEENFADYFNLTLIENPVDAQGNAINNSDYDYYVITSAVYDNGLIFHSSYDTEISFLCQDYTVTLNEFYTRLSCPKGSVPVIKSAQGKVIFISADSVQSYTIKDGYRCVTLCDGQTIAEESRSIYAVYPY